jgi:hypothetical protein
LIVLALEAEQPDRDFGQVLFGEGGFEASAIVLAVAGQPIGIGALFQVSLELDRDTLKHPLGGVRDGRLPCRGGRDAQP